MTRRPFHVLVKPAGPGCNLACDYCFYRPKEALYPDAPPIPRMSDEVLEALVRQTLEASPTEEVPFLWQGGEPTLSGLDFFRRVVDLQQRHGAGRRVTNHLQTNGVLLDDAWGGWLAEHDVLVGLSIDGPPELHDPHRVDRGGQATLDRVLAGLEVLERHGVRYNLLTVVHRANAERPEAVYDHLTGLGAAFLQFIPLVDDPDPDPVPGALEPGQLGAFLSGVFDRWVRRDVGRVFVQAFDQALAPWVGETPTLCIHQETCGQGLVVEHNGDVYCCDHFVDTDHHLGNLLEVPLEELVDGPRQRGFARAKANWAVACRSCPWLAACGGGCPKHRTVPQAAGPPQNVLCGDYQAFHSHTAEAMRFMAGELRAGRPASGVMAHLAGLPVAPPPHRNDPCPCHSGRRYKRCCGG